ncbi:MAG: ankyrin repeat domain-containing protein [Planctomycetales bacterium]|nr:ankyrin repeat domain-containing protein [Planctomycetales bacterium]
MTIHDFCRVGDVEAVRSMILNDPSLVDADDAHNWRPIFHAAIGKHADVVRLLLEFGADLSAHDGDALHYASEVPGNAEVVSLLVLYGALDPHVRPSDDISRQLLAAIFLNNANRVRSLLAHHPRLSTYPDGRGDYPIHHAARTGNVEIVQLLVECGADANAKNSRGHTVLYCAGGHGHQETVRLLLHLGVDSKVRFTHDGKNLAEWLAQYPDDQRLVTITELIAEIPNG